MGTNPIRTARFPDSQTPPDGQTEMTELLTVWLAQRKGLLCVGPQFAHARVPAVAPVPCTCSSFPCRFVCSVQQVLFLLLVLAPLRAPGSWLWLLAPCSWLLFLPSPTSFHPFHLLLYNTIRHDTTGHCEDTLVPSSSLLYSLPFITASFVFCPSLSLPCFFLLCLSPVQPPPGPILILETRVVETSRSSSPPLARLLLATPARHHDREAPRRHQQQNTTHPNPPATTAVCHPLSSNPVRFAREATSFLSASSLCACYYRASLALSSLSPLRARHVRLLGPFVPRLASSPTKACISRQSAPLRAPERTYTPANSTTSDLHPRARTFSSPRRF